MPADIKIKIESLRKKIREHDYKYYVFTEPSVSDEEYDKLVKELEKHEAEHPKLISPDSPTQRVGKDLTKDFKPVRHKVPMLSLANTYNEDELYDFDRKVKEALPENEKVDYIVELKIDGASV
ncbi:MAG: NAD-dependent DNA ligase LigA, partial [Ignavibacteriaceae bacterium]